MIRDPFLKLCTNKKKKQWNILRTLLGSEGILAQGGWERERERRGPYWQRTLQSSELDSTIRKIRLILGLLSNSQQSQPSREVTIRSIQTIQYSIILSFFLYLSFFLAHGGSPNTFGLPLLVPFFLSNCTLPSLSPSYTSIQQLLHFLVINKKIIH